MSAKLWNPKVSNLGFTKENITQRKEQLLGRNLLERELRDQITDTRLGEQLELQRRRLDFEPLAEGIQQLTEATTLNITPKKLAEQYKKMIEKAAMPGAKGPELREVLKGVSEDMKNRIANNQLTEEDVPQVLKIIEDIEKRAGNWLYSPGNAFAINMDSFEIYKTGEKLKSEDKIFKAEPGGPGWIIKDFGDNVLVGFTQEEFIRLFHDKPHKVGRLPLSAKAINDYNVLVNAAYDLNSGSYLLPAPKEGRLPPAPPKGGPAAPVVAPPKGGPAAPVVAPPKGGPAAPVIEPPAPGGEPPEPEEEEEVETEEVSESEVVSDIDDPMAQYKAALKDDPDKFIRLLTELSPFYDSSNVDKSKTEIKKDAIAAYDWTDQEKEAIQNSGVTAKKLKANDGKLIKDKLKQYVEINSVIPGTKLTIMGNTIEGKIEGKNINVPMAVPPQDFMQQAAIKMILTRLPTAGGGTFSATYSMLLDKVSEEAIISSVEAIVANARAKSALSVYSLENIKNNLTTFLYDKTNPKNPARGSYTKKLKSLESYPNATQILSPNVVGKGFRLLNANKKGRRAAKAAKMDGNTIGGSPLFNEISRQLDGMKLPKRQKMAILRKAMST